MCTCANCKACFVTAIVAGSACALSIVADPRLTTYFDDAQVARSNKQALIKPLAETSNPISYSTDSLRTTELPNHYRLVEKINFESDIANSFSLIEDGKTVFEVPEPTFWRVFSTYYPNRESHGLPLPVPNLVFMSANERCLNAISLNLDGNPKYVLRNVPTMEPPRARAQIDVDDPKLGVNIDPGSTTVDCWYPRVDLVWDGKTYLPSADSMRWNAMYGGDIHDLFHLYTKTLQQSYDAFPKDRSAPLTSIVISRAYELIYEGNAEDARKLLDSVYPRVHYLRVHIPFDHYFDSSAMEPDPHPMRLLTKAQVWKEMIKYLQKNTLYLPTLKALNPGLFE